MRFAFLAWLAVALPAWGQAPVDLTSQAGFQRTCARQVDAAAAKTDTFLGARYRRLVKRRGKLKALVAVARSILTIVWHLLADPTSRYCDLGPDFFDTRITPERRKQNHIHQLEALGYKVTLEPAALPAAA